MKKFLDNIKNHHFVNQEITEKYGYIDFLLQGPKLPSTYDIRAILPKEISGDSVGTTPGIPLSNGQFVYYCRAKIDVVTRLLQCPEFEKLYLADSWNSLFAMDFPYWGEIFDVQTERKDGSGEITQWRGKFCQLTDKDKIVKAYVPHVYAGDILPNLELEAWHIERYFHANDSDMPCDLQVAIAAVNEELIKYLTKHPEALYQLRPRQFEELISEILDGFGWEVELTPATRDGGYDIFAISKDITGMKSSWIIECKKYAPQNKVGIDFVRSLCGVKNDKQVANAMLATTSFFTSGVHDAKNSRYDLELVDYDGIVDWLNDSYKKDSESGLLLPA